MNEVAAAIASRRRGEEEGSNYSRGKVKPVGGGQKASFFFFSEDGRVPWCIRD